MRRKKSSVLLFLDTPRTEGGLNHRFFVAAPGTCAESRVIHYARAARANENGDDYIAVSRPATQFSRGSARVGLELLVLAGISTKDPALAERQRVRLTSMLASLQDAPMSVENSPIGLLISSGKIAEFERELHVDAVPVGSFKGGVRYASWNFIVNNPIKFIAAIVLMTVILGVLIARPQSPRSHEQGSAAGLKKLRPLDGEDADVQEEKSWDFLRTDPDWRNLGRMTGLHDNWDTRAAQVWAGKLLKAADRDTEKEKPTTAGDLKNNTSVQELLSAVRSVNRTDEMARHDTDLVSENWLKNQEDARGEMGLVSFWETLIGRNPHEYKSANALKKLLFDWEGALVGLAKSTDLSVPAALKDELSIFAMDNAKVRSEAGLDVPILVKSDLDRFNRINKILGGDAFAEAVKTLGEGDKSWKINVWEKRFQSMPGISVQDDGQHVPDLKGFIRKLYVQKKS